MIMMMMINNGSFCWFVGQHLCKLFCTQVCTRLFLRILSQVNVKLQPNEKSNISWIRFPLSFCLMQKPYMCSAVADWSVCMGNVRVQTHYLRELSSAGEPLYYGRHGKRGHISVSNWVWGRQEEKGLRNEQFTRNILYTFQNLTLPILNLGIFT